MSDLITPPMVASGLASGAVEPGTPCAPTAPERDAGIAAAWERRS